MNKIEIFKPFGEAYELMKTILFRPFDLGKWLTIGFAAFLTNLGGGFNYNFDYPRRKDWREVPALRDFVDWANTIPHWVFLGVLAGFVFSVVVIAIVFTWLRARGRFIFTDCIVKNRGAIAEPWREFREQGNSYFFFALLVGIVFGLLAGALALPFMLPIWRHATFLHLHDVYLISMIAIWGAVVLLLVFAWALIAQIMVVVMYRQRCRAGTACRVALRLIANYPGEILLYCLFWIVITVATAIIACLTTCATCCLALLPYIGTVILLPVFVCLRAFGLFFLRQFGRDYDVWGTSAEPPAPPPLPA